MRSDRLGVSFWIPGGSGGDPELGFWVGLAFLPRRQSGLELELEREGGGDEGLGLLLPGRFGSRLNLAGADVADWRLWARTWSTLA